MDELAELFEGRTRLVEKLAAQDDPSAHAIAKRMTALRPHLTYGQPALPEIGSPALIAAK